MLINERQRIVIYTPFKVGSQSLHKYFDNRESWWRVIGKHPLSPIYGPHTADLATRWEEYEILLPLRDPFSRVVSMWKYYRQTGGDLLFPAWLDERLTSPELGPVAGQYRFTGVLHLETMGAELKARGLDYGEFPHLHKGTENHTLTIDERDRIVQVHGIDFLVGGYYYPRRNQWLT